MATTLTLPITPIKQTIDEIFDEKFSRHKENIYHLIPPPHKSDDPRHDQILRTKAIKKNALTQAVEALRIYSNDPNLTATSKKVYISIETEKPVGTQDASGQPAPLALPGLEEPTYENDSPHYIVHNRTEWKKLTKGQWLHWNHNTLNLTKKKPERGKKFITPAENIEQFIASRVDDAIECAIKYGITSYKILDQNN